MAAKVTKIGPVIVVEDDSEEYIATFQVCYNQVGQSSCAITTWEIDGEVKTHQLSGTRVVHSQDRQVTVTGWDDDGDWSRFWSAFLGLLPSHLALDVAQHEDKLKY